MNASEASGSIDVGSEPSPLNLLGTFLREERERRGISSATLAAQLRMGEEQLQALEAGDGPRLPELVFVIAQARRVADALGVDVNPLVAPLKQQSQILKPAPTPLSSSKPAGRSQPRARLTAQNVLGGEPRAWLAASGWLGAAEGCGGRFEDLALLFEWCNQRVHIHSQRIGYSASLGDHKHQFR